ncbi:hypothetical protein IZ6_25670 [Terrihabitans soli]|uniref:Uncharacterized protein n=1 Tax=Terrihabitans soli TaxID=708113 RepID=A0A6S6QX48_9HYPH|nr:hypothetical protein [Terrihabitans soli]BCJ91832.1 hypothetical protein IZ6_25670 [Terrihabitans soli]
MGTSLSESSLLAGFKAPTIDAELAIAKRALAEFRAVIDFALYEEDDHWNRYEFLKQWSEGMYDDLAEEWPEWPEFLKDYLEAEGLV